MTTHTGKARTLSLLGDVEVLVQVSATSQEGGVTIAPGALPSPFGVESLEGELKLLAASLHGVGRGLGLPPAFRAEVTFTVRGGEPMPLLMPGLDLAVVAALLDAFGTLHPAYAGCLFYGGVGVQGRLLPTRGVVVAAETARVAGTRLVCAASERSYCLFAGDAIPLEGVEGLRGPPGSATFEYYVPPAPHEPTPLGELPVDVFTKQKILDALRRDVPILLVGPPGCGRTSVARSLPALLPPRYSTREAEVQSAASRANLPVVRGAPFRAPHHTTSLRGVHGTALTPGEVELAHGGVLFLDELPEFRKDVMEDIARAFCTGHVVHTLGGYTARRPAEFALVMAMHPCPCGFHGSARCTCTTEQVARYEARVRDLTRDLGPTIVRMDAPC